jgi:hypothetical protein
MIPATPLASLTHTLVVGSARPIRSPAPAGANALSGALGHASPLLTIGLLVVVGIACAGVVLCAAYATHRLDNFGAIPHALGRLLTARRWRPDPVRTHTRAVVSDLSRPAPVVPTPLLAPEATAQALRDLESSSAVAAASGQDWCGRSEDIPGVGRIEWDARTLRAFAYQPDVLYRLAFHRWRLQQGMLSEFEFGPVASRQEAGVEPRDASLHAGSATYHVAPTTEGRHAPPPGQQVTQADL